MEKVQITFTASRANFLTKLISINSLKMNKKLALCKIVRALKSNIKILLSLHALSPCFF